MGAITSRYSEQIRALDSMAEELENVTVPDLGSYEPKRGEADSDDGQYPWLFDSARGYLEQIDAYKAWESGRP